MRTDRADGPSPIIRSSARSSIAGIEHFLDRRIEAVDLVDEQDVAVLKVGEQRREVARLGDNRARRGAESDAHLAGKDAGKRRLAEARGAVEAAHGRAPRRGSWPH